MKNKKILIIPFLLVLLLVSVLGIANSLAAGATFEIINATIQDKSPTTDAEIISFQDDELIINTTFHQLNDYVSYRLVVKNISDKNYKIKQITATNPNTHLEYTYNDLVDTVVNSNNSFNLDITVTYKTTITQASERDSSDTYKLNIEFTDESGNPVDQDITINPSTGDSIYIYIIIGAISLIGLIIILVKNKTTKKLMILLVVSIPFAVNAFTSSIVLDFETEVKLRDKLLVKQIVNGVEEENLVSYDTIPTKPSDPEKNGYDFEGWYIGTTPYDFTTPLKDDTSITAKFTPKNYTITYNLNGGDATNNENYTIETPTFTLNKPTKLGFDFVGWTGSCGETPIEEVTIELGSIGDKTYTANFKEKEFEVTFEANNGSEPTTRKVKYNYEVGELPEVEKTNYIFVNWYTEDYDSIVTSTTKITDAITFYAKWKKSIYFANIENSNLNVFNKSTIQINITNPTEIEETYTYSSNDESIATVNSTGLITANSIGSTKIVITGSESKQTKEVNITVNPRVYTLTFEAYDGLPVLPIVVEEGSSLETIPESTLDDYQLLGWFDAEIDGNELTTSTVFEDEMFTNGEKIYYAHWKFALEPICKRATLLHYQDCARTDSKGCKADGFTGANKTLFYGSIVDQNAYKAGDAFDCDVNGNGQIDVDENGFSTERFYYLRDVNEDTAALIYYSNVINSVPNNTTSLAYDSNNKNYAIPEVLISNLPSKEANIANSWSNVSLTNTTIQVTTEEGLTTVSNKDLPIIDYSLYSSRMPILEDITTACNVEPGESPSVFVPIPVQSYTGCSFIFENTTYVDANFKSGFWISTVVGNGTTNVYRVTGSQHVLSNTNASASTGSGIRPVIEVPHKLMEPVFDKDEFTVSFDTQGAKGIDILVRRKGEKIGQLPSTPFKDGYIFRGWFSDTTYTYEVTADTIITQNTIVYAKWLPIGAVAEYNNTGYNTIAEAILKTGTAKARIKLLADIADKVTIPAGKDIELDLNNYTIMIAEDKNAIDNSGTLKVMNGSITTTAPKNAAINNAGTLYIDGITIIANGSRSALYNKENGVAYIDNSNFTSSTDQRQTIMNLLGATLYINSGNIISTGLDAISNEGTMTIGTEDGYSNTETPLIKGAVNGIISTTNYSFFDGTIKGITTSVPDTSIITKETNYNFSETQETEGSNTYNILKQVPPTGNYAITLDANGGTVNPGGLTIQIGNKLGTIPEPTRGGYEFAGWYKELTFDTEVNSNTIPTSNSKYYAKWEPKSSTVIAAFIEASDAIVEYYNKIAQWKDDSDFETLMVVNFNNCDCSCTDNTCSTGGTVFCDKPKGYDTGTHEKVNVFLYDEESKLKTVSVAYAKGEDGVIYNLIPGVVYYWELASDVNVNGLVRFTGSRRILEAGDIRNIRDLGGLNVSYTDSKNQTVTGTIKYGKLLRGIKLSQVQYNITELTNLGITEEVDLRSASEISSSKDVKFPSFKNYEVIHYQIDTATHADKYVITRTAVKNVMQDIVAGENIYFHCRIGTDRTGTLAYILEGLLGVSEEDRLQDYDLSFFYGLVNRTRYYDTDPTSSVSTTEKFVYMHNFLNTNQSIYDWFMEGSTNETEDKQLIENFRNVMIEKN